VAVAAGLYLAFLGGAGATNSTQIVITATVTPDPCTVSSSSDNQTVQLGDVSADTLQNTGATSPQKDFSLLTFPL
jgi:type 1 fimbria pilin